MRKQSGSSKRQAALANELSVAWTEPALGHLADVVTYVAGHDPQAAEQLRDRVIKAVDRAAALPYSGRVVPELGRQDVREIIVRPYRIVYRVSETHIMVWAVFQGRRLLTEEIMADGPE